jgi:hypothetical protein
MHPALNGLVSLLKRRLENFIMKLHQAKGGHQCDPEPDQEQHPEYLPFPQGPHQRKVSQI